MPAASAVAADDDEDVPKRLPQLAWEREVACDGHAEPPHPLGAASRRVPSPWPATHCSSTSTAAADAPDGHFRLTRFDIATGAEQWATEVGPSAAISAYDDIVVINDKKHFEVYDAATGVLPFPA